MRLKETTSKIYFLILLLSFILPYLDYKNLLLSLFVKKTNAGIINSTSDLIQFWLLVAGSWVAFETLKLRRLTSKQVDLQMAPILVIYFRENPRRITVKNIGQGVAFDVKFEKVTLVLEGIRKIAEYKLKIDNPPILIPKEERRVRGQMFLNGNEILKGAPGDGTVWLDPKYSLADFEFVLSYSDMEKRTYNSKVSAGINDVKLLGYKRSS